ncbi:MAG: IgGFc-binding protein, partial [Thermodesulfovibrionia bacterium]|nr:IgGFc-binding protein [Thermodesulfovibrionia bacterium]
MKRIFSIFNVAKDKGLLAFFAICLLLSFIGSAQAANEIYFTIPSNLISGSIDIYLAAGDSGATGTIVNQDASFNQAFVVPVNGITIVTIPDSQRLTVAGSAQNRGFIITPDFPVAAYLLDVNTPVASNDITVLFPIEGLSTRYRVMGYSGWSQSQLAIVATADNTTVTITPKVNFGSGQAAGIPFNVTLNRLQAVLYNSEDVTGSLIESTIPVAVFGGHNCTNVPAGVSACDHLIEQMPGVEFWGTSFPLVPTARSTAPGDVLRVLADTDGTVVTITDSGGNTVYNLDSGNFFEIGSPFINELSYLSSNNPVLVGQFMVGASLTGGVGDPAFSLVPSSNLWLNSYIFNVPNGYVDNYVGIAIPASAESSLRVDNVQPSALTAIPGTTLVGGNIHLIAGQHIIVAGSPFMLTQHGFDNNWASYFGIAGHSISGGGHEVIGECNEFLTITNDTLPSAPVGINYSYQLGVTGGESYTWSIADKIPSTELLNDPDYNASILDDLSIDENSGVLSWNPLPRITENPDPLNPIYYIDFTVQVNSGEVDCGTATYRYTDPDAV